jgi:hypothetical protein
MYLWIRVAFAFAVAGGMIIWYGAQHLRLTAGSASNPEPITLANLIKRGPKGNRHLRISDFTIGETAIEVGTANQLVKDAYLPIMPVGAGDGKVIVIKTSSMDKQPLRFSAEPIEGMLSDDELPRDAREQLQARYRAFDFATAMVFEKDAHAAEAEFVWIFIALGGVLCFPLIATLAYNLCTYWLERRRVQQAM